MVCEKYSKVIKDCALGELSSGPGTDLREHLVQCASCRDEFDRAKGVAALLNSGVKMLVEGEPSPQFATRLRARIANESGPARPDWRAWVPVAASAFVLAVLLIGVMIRIPRQPRRDVVTIAQIPPKSKIVAPAITEGASTSVSQPQIHSKYRTAQPEVLVPPGQLLAVMQFASAVNAGRVESGESAAAQQQSEKPLTIEVIQISPLVIPRLDDVSALAGASGGF